jgi:hypothetical protein
LDLRQAPPLEFAFRMCRSDAAGESDAAGLHEPVRLAVITAADLPLLERFVRAYCVEDRHTFSEDLQPAALAALAAGEPFGRGRLVELAERRVGYVVLSWSFSIEAGGPEACVDERPSIKRGARIEAAHPPHLPQVATRRRLAVTIPLLPSRANRGPKLARLDPPGRRPHSCPTSGLRPPGDRSKHATH